MRATSGVLFVSLVSFIAVDTIFADPTNNKLIIEEFFFPSNLVKYVGKHDIVNIHVPIYSNVRRTSAPNYFLEIDPNPTIFFVEADTTPEGSRINRGLYVKEKGAVKKLLDNGRDVTSAPNLSFTFVGADDGIYIYNPGVWYFDSPIKYGTFTDSIIGIAIEKAGDVLYILNENHEVYKVTDTGYYNEKVVDIFNAQQIVIDYSDNLYYYSGDKQVYVRTKDYNQIITGLPKNPSNITIIRPPFILNEGVPIIVDDNMYIVYPNTTIEYLGVEFNLKSTPTAFSMETTSMQYCAYDKKIYEYNIPLIFKATISKLLKTLQI